MSSSNVRGEFAAIKSVVVTWSANHRDIISSHWSHFMVCCGSALHPFRHFCFFLVSVLAIVLAISFAFVQRLIFWTFEVFVIISSRSSRSYIRSRMRCASYATLPCHPSLRQIGGVCFMYCAPSIHVPPPSKYFMKSCCCVYCFRRLLRNAAQASV
jgi:hypothetical protein